MSSEKVWAQPFKWNAQANGSRPRVFCASMADVFDERAPEEWRLRLFTVIMQTPALDWLILTKRPQNAAKYFQKAGPPNIWLGVSVEDQKTADERIPLLLDIPAAIRFVSYEPALGPVTFRPEWWPHDQRGCGNPKCEEYGAPGIDWIIVGGESGPGARPFNVEWARNTIKTCRDADIACFVKQLGARIVGDTSEFSTIHRLFYPGGSFVPPIIGPNVGNYPEGVQAFQLCNSKGGDWNEWPADLRVREFPAQTNPEGEDVPPRFREVEKKRN